MIAMNTQSSGSRGRTSAAPRQRGGGQRGFSLVELLVASAVGLLLVGGLTAIFVQTGQTNNDLARLNLQLENSRFALQVLRDDLWHAGFWGGYAPGSPTPTAMPPVCAAFNEATWTAAVKENFLRLPVIGAQGAALALAGCSARILNHKSGTDALMIRHASTCIADRDPYANKNCENFSANKLYLQVSFCSDDTSDYLLTTDADIADQTPFLLKTRDTSVPSKDCATVGYTTTYTGVRKIVSNLYYINTDNILMRSEFDYDSTSSAVIQQAAQPLVEGIEYLVVEYGVDTNGDGSPDGAFVRNPANGLTDAVAIATAWSNVVAVKLYLLGRTLEETSGAADSKTYLLGSTSLGPFSDHFRRHVYSMYVRLHNVAGRREAP